MGEGERGHHRAFVIDHITRRAGGFQVPNALLFLLNSDERGSAAEFAVFHIMSRILEATNGMCMPLPPGKSCVLLF